jgi:outer membrane protein assembly factor BamE (lipoprotein component of BamABCDE complex)
MTFRALIPWLLLFASALACTAGNYSKLTPEGYAAVTGGMSPDEVEALLGSPSTVQKTGGETIWYYKGGDTSAAITFRGKQVVHKGETGLNVGDAEYSNRQGGIDPVPAE